MVDHSKLTPALLKELDWIGDHNGEGVIDQYGKFLAGGATRSANYSGSWLRLVAHGCLVGVNGRLVMSPDGWAIYSERRAKR